MGRPMIVMKEGTSGGYLLQSSDHEYLGIFKPIDEEAFASNNPKGYTGKMGTIGFRNGILSGECAAREVAAYLLDSDGYS